MYQHQAVATTATRVSGALLHRMHWFCLVNQQKYSRGMSEYAVRNHLQHIEKKPKIISNFVLFFT